MLPEELARLRYQFVIIARVAHVKLADPFRQARSWSVRNRC